MANRNFPSAGKVYSGHVMPVLIDCNFVVDSSNANGLGVSSLKGPYVQNVFMFTSSTPGTGSSNPSTPGIAVVNPNPAAGTIVVQLQDKFNRLLTQGSSVVTPVSGSPLKVDNSALTAGVAYVISTLGSSTRAQWTALGVPSGVVPAVGVAFIAASVGAGANSSTSRVMASAAAGSGVFSIELVGNSNLAIAPDSSQGFGSQIILQCRKASSSSAAPVLTMNSFTPAGSITMDSYTPAGTNDSSTPPIFSGTPAVLTGSFAGTPAVLTGSVSAPAITSASAIAAPADGSIISLSFLLSNSSVMVAGE